ncbi:Sir2 family NAD-dependent protein deacetylase [Puniceibacterium confluentis]|uniref:Sir2 family NAD-dependent protein deacetylase n=1 Tax=Puniceibacterium confluentis TaxID=1958944 RepID=UPI0011B7C00D|nr:Sir2 family NAD-dependent protein deacetylase [Puniceibacterium confluentis]
MKTCGKIVILTGAGVSAESGLGTFRDTDGLWANTRIEEVATPQAFARDPAKVHAFYNMRRRAAAAARPNAAHFALARLQEHWPAPVILITQNVDGLHAAAGGAALQMHGALSGALCAECGHRWSAPVEMTPRDLCPRCGAAATRPDIVWFGEMPHHMAEIEAHLGDCMLFVAIGTSGAVYPAAGFGAGVARRGIETLEINAAATDVSAIFDRHIIGRASQVVPAWVAQLLDRDPA